MRCTTVVILMYAATYNNVFAYHSCFQSAGERYGVHEHVLKAIALTESAMDVNATNRNANGSLDVGLMQINSQWFPQLAEMGIQPGDLWNPCTSIHVGAWILAGEIRRFGYNWRAIGAYNAGPANTVARERRREKYAVRVYQNLLRIYRRPDDGMFNNISTHPGND